MEAKKWGIPAIGYPYQLLESVPDPPRMRMAWLTPLPVPGSGAGGLAHGQIWLHLYAQGSWAEGDSASASPFLLGDELEQDLVSSSRSTMTSG